MNLGKGEGKTVLAVVDVLDDTGEPWAGVAYNEAGLEIWYWKLGGSEVELTLSESNWTERTVGAYEVTLPSTLAEAVGVIGVRGKITDGKIIGDSIQVVGYDPDAAIAQAVWDRLTTALTTSGSIGKLIADLLDAAISSRHEAGAAVGSVTGDIGGKVLGGGSGTITGVGARSDVRAWANAEVELINVDGQDRPMVGLALRAVTAAIFADNAISESAVSAAAATKIADQVRIELAEELGHVDGLNSRLSVEWAGAVEAGAAVLDELTEDDGEGNLRLTAKALEQVSVELGDIEVPIDEEAIADAVAPIVWGHAQRTLTSAAQVTEEETSAELITRRRGDSWSVSLTGLGNITDAEEIWLTLKRQPNQLDSAAVLQVTSTGGLVIGLTAEPTDAAIAVDDATAGNLTITVEPAATKLVAPRTYEYDIQVRRTGGQIQTLAAGQWSVPPDVTRSV